MSSCSIVHGIWERQTQGLSVTAEEAAFVADHLARCEPCSTEAAVTDLMAIRSPAGALPFDEDDISRRKWINETVSRALTEAGESSRRPNSAALGLLRSRWFQMGAAACLLLGLGVALWHPWVDPRPDRTDLVSLDPARVPSTAAASKLLLTAGEVTSSHADTVVGEPFAAGTHLRTGNGRAVIDFKGSAKVLMHAETAIRIVDSAEQHVKIRVDRGRVFTQVEKDAFVRGFVIATRAGEIRITGTVLSVAVNDEAVRLHVVRGSVEVSSGARMRKVLAGETAMLDKGSISQLDADEEKHIWSMLSDLQVIDRAQAGTVEIRSIPAGATVEIDGMTLGTTPFRALVAAGTRKIALAKEGLSPITEILTLEANEHVARVFDLSATPEDAPRAQIGKGTAKGKRAPATGRPDARGGPDEADPSALLAEAQALRASKDWHGAAAAYAKLIEHHPMSNEARTALISLGTIQLEHLGKPARALVLYDRYLRDSSSGNLAQEARFAKSKALRALGRVDQERRVLEVFVSDFPDAPQTPWAKERLAELR